ncbi:MAG TPA: tetratricopeptide repeat protein, partial [bacterium]|nr:tetratricopeptide repeat protein [bacterium]
AIGVVLTAWAVAAFASVDAYKKAADLDPNSVIKRYNLGKAYYDEGRYDDAINTLKRVLSMNRQDAESHARVDPVAAQMLGIIFFNVKNNDNEAIKYFKRVQELNPADGDNMYFMGLSYLRKGDNEKALEVFLEAVAKNASNSTEANFRIGQVYYRKNMFGDAISYLEKTVAASPKHVEARELLGIIYHKRKNTDKAITNLAEVVKYAPENFNAHYLLGLNYYEKKQYDKMMSAYKKAIEINPGFADAYYNLGMAYYYRNEFEEAIKQFEEAKRLNPSDASTFSILAQTKTAAYESRLSSGTMLMVEEEYLKAIEEFELALAAKPGDSEARKNLATARDAVKKEIPGKLKAAKEAFDAKKYSEAYSLWQYVAGAEPNNREAVNGLKKVESNLSDIVAAREKSAAEALAAERYEQAISEYREAEKIAGASDKRRLAQKITEAREKQRVKVNGLNARAKRLFDAGDYRGALNAYSEAVKFDSRNNTAINGITTVNSKMETDRERFLALGTQNASNDPKKAEEYFRRVLALDPNNREANRQIERLTGRKSQAAVDAGKVRSLYYEGVDKYVNGDIENAIKIWESVLSLDKAHVEAQKNIRRAQEKLAAIKTLSR